MKPAAIGLLAGLLLLPRPASASDPAAATPPKGWDNARFMAVGEIEPGMKGRGLSVFKGTQIEEFGVEILGILKTASPGGDLILARLSGQGLERSGVVAGMSGSPVFVKDRLVGALAFAWPFATEPIAGITPIAEMLALEDRRAADLDPAAHAGHGTQGMPPAAWEALWAARGAQALAILAGEPAPAGGGLAPLRVPVSVGGFRAEAGAEVARLLDRLGFVPVEGGVLGSDTAAGPAELAPGSAVGVELVRGDAHLAAIGTVTWIDGTSVLAFGHRMFNLGGTAYPLVGASIVTVLPRLTNSIKMGTTGRTLGAVTRDYRAGVMASLGRPPRLVPLEIELALGTRTESLRFEILDAQLLTPALAGLIALNSLESLGREGGASTLRLQASVLLRDGRRVETGHVLAGFSPPVQFAGELARLVALVHGNPFEPVALEAIRVSVSVEDEIRAAFIEQVSLPPGPHRAGSAVSVQVGLRDYRGRTWSHLTRIEIPPATPPGEYALVVCDGSEATQQEEKRAPSRYTPRSLGRLFDLLQDRLSEDTLILQLVDAVENPVVAGRELPRLPRSLAGVVATPLSTGRVDRAAGTVIHRQVEKLDTVLRGCHTLRMTVSASR